MYNSIQRGNQNTKKVRYTLSLYSLVLLLIFCLSPFVFAGVKKRSRKEKKKETAATAEAAAAAPAVDEEARGKEIAVDHKTKKVR